MNYPQISFSTGVGITFFSTLLFGGGALLSIISGIKAVNKPAQSYVTVTLCLLILLIVYYLVLFWTNIKVLDHQTMELTTKAVFGQKTKRYENITKVQLYRTPKSGYALRIYQKDIKNSVFTGGFNYKNAKALANFFPKTALPFETTLFQEK